MNIIGPFVGAASLSDYDERRFECVFSRIISMKNTPLSTVKTKPKSGEITDKITAARKRSDAAKKMAQIAKADFKRVRKTFKQAKKAAKAARRELKELKKALAAAKAAVSRRKASAKTRKQQRSRKVIPVIAPIAELAVSAAVSPEVN